MNILVVGGTEYIGSYQGCLYLGSLDAKIELSWEPQISFDELVAEMIREDLKPAERDEVIKNHGYKVMDYNE